MDPALKDFLLIVGTALAAYFGAYFKRRGEDQAIKDGFAEVLRQTAETTKATKAIETRISDEMWDRQKRWEMKRDFIFEAAKGVGKIHTTILELNAFYETERHVKETGGEPRDKLEAKVTREWTGSSLELGNLVTLSSVVCNQELVTQLAGFTNFVLERGSGIRAGDQDFLTKYSEEYASRVHKTYQAMRKELATPSITPQSNVSSATPIPVPPIPGAK